MLAVWICWCTAWNRRCRGGGWRFLCFIVSIHSQSLGWSCTLPSTPVSMCEALSQRLSVWLCSLVQLLFLPASGALHLWCPSWFLPVLYSHTDPCNCSSGTGRLSASSWMGLSRSVDPSGSGLSGLQLTNYAVDQWKVMVGMDHVLTCNDQLFITEAFSWMSAIVTVTGSHSWRFLKPAQIHQPLGIDAVWSPFSPICYSRIVQSHLGDSAFIILPCHTEGTERTLWVVQWWTHCLFFCFSGVYL